MGVRDDGVPVTSHLFGRIDDLHPVTPTDLLRRIKADVHNTHLVVSAEPVIIHDPNLQRDLADVHVGDVELEVLVVDRDERVFLHRSLPLHDPLVFVDLVDFYVGVCVCACVRACACVCVCVRVHVGVCACLCVCKIHNLMSFNMLLIISTCAHTCALCSIIIIYGKCVHGCTV